MPIPAVIISSHLLGVVGYALFRHAGFWEQWAIAFFTVFAMMAIHRAALQGDENEPA